RRRARVCAKRGDRHGVPNRQPGVFLGPCGEPLNTPKVECLAPARHIRMTPTVQNLISSTIILAFGSFVAACVNDATAATASDSSPPPPVSQAFELEGLREGRLFDSNVRGGTF